MNAKDKSHLVELSYRTANCVVDEQAQAKTVLRVSPDVSKETDCDDEYDWRRQQEVRNLFVLKVSQEAHTPISLLNISVGHRDGIIAPRRYIFGFIACQHVAHFNRILADVNREFDVQMVAKKVEVIRV